MQTRKETSVIVQELNHKRQGWVTGDTIYAVGSFPNFKDAIEYVQERFGGWKGVGLKMDMKPFQTTSKMVYLNRKNPKERQLVTVTHRAIS